MANYQIAHPALPPLASGAPDSPAPAIAAETPLNDGDMVAVTRQVKRRRMLHDEAHRATTPEVQAAVKREFSVHAEIAAGDVDAVAMPPWALAFQNQNNETMQAIRNEVKKNNETMQAIRNEFKKNNETMQAIRNEVKKNNETMQAIRNEVNDIQRMEVNQNMQAIIRNEINGHLQAIRNKANDIQRMLRNNATSSNPEHPIFPLRNRHGILPDDAQGSGAAFPTTRFELDSLNDRQLANYLEFYGLDTAPVETGLSRLKMHLGIRL
eukprot:scaffold2206_cov95-Cylindrotheca_fusiformis.AAC.7